MSIDLSLLSFSQSLPWFGSFYDFIFVRLVQLSVVVSLTALEQSLAVTAPDITPPRFGICSSVNDARRLICLFSYFPLELSGDPTPKSDRSNAFARWAG